MAIRDEDVAQLKSMGFPEEQVRNALQMTGGNVEMAVNSLLSGEIVGDSSGSGAGFASSTTTTANSSNSRESTVRGSASQYSYGSDGRSACTCIALTAAENVAKASNDTNGNAIITPQLLDNTIQQGVERYRKLRDVLATSSVEHLSAEEVLTKDSERATGSHERLFGVRMSVAGGIRQGALNRDVDHPLGMKSVLGGLINEIRMERRSSSSNGTGDSSSNSHSSPMICILITKSPETVLLCLPPTDFPSNGAETQKYWLIDSHPRPQLLHGAESSYAMPHDSFESLLQSLRDVFPFTDLGPDVPPMMADMYNMFDLYALEQRNDR